MSRTWDRIRKVAYCNMSPVLLPYEVVDAALNVFVDPSDNTWVANEATALRQNFSRSNLMLDTATAHIVSRAMSRIFFAKNMQEFAYNARIIARAIERFTTAPGYSVHELAYAALQDGDVYTYFSRGVLPGDLFSMIGLYLRAPYRTSIPTGPGKLRNGTLHWVCELEEHPHSCSPLATTNARGELIISQYSGILEAHVFQLHGAYKFESYMRPVYQEAWRRSIQKYVVAFSATHVAVCEVLGDERTNRKHAISIRHTNNAFGTDGVAIEQPSHRHNIPGATFRAPIVTNGDGTLYISDYQAGLTTACITRYRLDNSPQGPGWIRDQFVCPSRHGHVYCASGEFICVRDMGIHTVYRLPTDIDCADAAPKALWTFQVGSHVFDDTSVCLDTSGNMIGIDTAASEFVLWTRELASETRRELMTVPWDYPVVGGHGGKPRPVLHPSGRIFIIHERDSDTGDRMICAQELVKE